MLFIALLIALGFEFVNGFHDTANAVATVIYTHSLPAEMAVVWSGAFNFLGVLTSTGAVAFGIVLLLPVELILQVGSSAGFAMVFALLIAAIIWNLGTWWLGLPASSSHTLIGSIIGVGIANALSRGMDGTSGVDWSKATEIGYALLLSPLVGFVFSALLLLALKFLVRNPTLYEAPKGNQPPPWWIRGILILTCTGVSFAHGSNDGQKGMGLIMLILIGTVPTTYALNRTPHAGAEPRRIVHRGVGGGSDGDRETGCRLSCAGRSATGRHALRLAAQDQRGHLRVARGAGAGDRGPG
jgi:PiT family inorganic phosphate transporter